MNKKSKLPKRLRFLLLLVFGGGMGYLVGRMLAVPSTNTIPPGMKLGMMALLIPAFLIVIAWHEAGHAVAGIKVGFDFQLYVVGPFMWEKDRSGWHFKWNKNVNTAGGLVLCLPVGAANLSRRFTMYAAGGPLASLLLTLLSWGLYVIFFQDNPASHPGVELAGTLLLFTALLSLLIFFVTAIPFHAGGFYSDGARVLRLLKGGDAAKFDILMLKIVTESTGGVRPKLLNLAEIAEAQTIAKRLNEPFGVYFHHFLHQAAFDGGDLDEAEKHLLDYIEEADKIPEGIRNGVWLDAAFFYAYAKKDLPTASRFWAQFKPTAMIPKAQILATEAALCAVKNEPEKMLSTIDAAMRALPDMMDKGMATALAEKLSLLKALGGG